MGQSGHDRIKHAIVAPRSTAARLAWMSAGLVCATGIRLALDRGAYGVPFLTFYPVILLSAVFLGVPYAALTALGAAAIVYTLFDSPFESAGLGPGQIVMMLLFLAAFAIIILTGQVLRNLVLENEEHLRQADAFNTELQHRTKNALQIMRSLIARRPRGEDPAEFYANLASRLDALAKANELLRFGVLESCDMGELIASTLRPFDARRFRVSGHKCVVGKSAATPLVMALHELCTNATKYGALSEEGGSVAIVWRPAQHGTGVEINWRECGGPAVSPPVRRGFGSRILVANGGLRKVQLNWNKDGLECLLEADGGANLDRGKIAVSHVNDAAVSCQ
ncbi:MAG: HWE histidine kinase domain-containing protein [Pseudomonadota bacterium]